MDARLIAFVGISLLLSVTPGPDMAVVTKNALAHGRRGVILTTTGIAVALAVWITATAVGLSALLRTSAELLFVLKIIGAAYLAYLGLSTLIESRRKPVDLLATAPLGVFFVTFLPQFVEPGQQVLPTLLELGLIFAVIGWTWMNVYGLLITRLRDFITAPRVRQWMSRITGVVLLGFGARLALERV